MQRPICGALRTTGLLLLAALSACTPQAELRKNELTELSLVLPGVYSNQQQVLLIMNVFAPMLSGNALYVRETDAADPRRVYSVRLWILEVSESGHLVASPYAFAEPERWREGAENPELFRSLLQQDLRPLTGCELTWEKTPQGYSASSASPRCPQRWKLEADQLSFSERPVDPGRGAPDPYFHFTRQSSPP